MKQLTLDTQEVITPNSEFDQRLIYVTNIKGNKCVLIATKYNGSTYNWIVIEQTSTLLSAGNIYDINQSFYEAIRWAIEEANATVYTLSSIDEFADWLKKD